MNDVLQKQDESTIHIFKITNSCTGRQAIVATGVNQYSNRNSFLLFVVETNNISYEKVYGACAGVDINVL